MTQPFIDFIAQSPSAFHASAAVAERLQAAGFTRSISLDDGAHAPGGHLIERDGAVVAWWVPEKPAHGSGWSAPTQIRRG